MLKKSSVVAVVPLVEPGTCVVPAGGDKAQKSEQDDDADKTSAATDGSFAAHIERPLAEHSEAGEDEQQRPPAAVPAPERTAGDVAGHDEQRDGAYADEDDGTDERRNAWAVAVLGFPGVTLCPHAHPAVRAKRPSAVRDRPAIASSDRRGTVAVLRHREVCREVRCS